MATEKKPQPVAKIRRYPVTAAIWRNETEKGGVFHSVTFSRSYKNEKGEYNDTESFNSQSLLTLSHVASKAFDKAEALTQAARVANGNDDEDDYDATTGEVDSGPAPQENI